MHIYKIINKVNGKIYIGQHSSDNLQKYWRQILNDAIRGVRGKTLLYRAIRKYGVDKFQIESLCHPTTKNELDLAEIFLISMHGSRLLNIGYNIAAGGGGTLGVRHNVGKNNPMWGKTHSDEWKLKMSKRMSGENNPMFGTPGTRLGKRHTALSLLKMSERASGKNNHMFGKRGKDCPNFGKKRPDASIRMKAYWANKKEIGELK